MGIVGEKRGVRGGGTLVVGDTWSGEYLFNETKCLFYYRVRVFVLTVMIFIPRHEMFGKSIWESGGISLFGHHVYCSYRRGRVLIISLLALL